MPILSVEIVGPMPDAERTGIAQRIADNAAVVLGSRPNGMWVKVTFLRADAYAENGDGPSDGNYPVLVSVLESQPPAGEALSKQISDLTRAIASACGRPPERVHIIVEPAGSGRVAFGGRLVT